MRVLSALTLALLLGSVSANAASTTFSSYFNNGSGTAGDDNASQYNWSAAIGTAGTVDQTLSLPNAVGVSQGATSPGVPVISGQSTSAGFLFAVPDSAPGAMLLHTTTLTTSSTFQDNPQPNWFRKGSGTLSGLDYGTISHLSVFTRAATGSGLVMRFALQVNGAWCVSATGFSQSDVNAWEQRICSAGTTQWHTGIFVSGTWLDDDVSDNPLVTFSAGDVVTGYGIYVDCGALSGTAARVRLDSFEVSSSHVTASTPVVSYAGAAAQEEFKDAMELSDGTLLIAGTAENLDWLSAPKIQLPPLSLPNRNTGRTAFVMRLSSDLQTVLGTWHLPAGQGWDIRWLKSTNKPGTSTGAIYLSGSCDATSGEYFIARLNNNFVSGNPTAFSWVKLAKMSATFGDNLGLQAWDVGGDGRVAYADETGNRLRILFLDAAGAPLKLGNLRGSHWPAGVILDDASRLEGLGIDFPGASSSGISFPIDLRSWTESDRLAILPDGNGEIKRGTWPLDLFTEVQDKNGTTTGVIEYGYTGYQSAGKHRIGGITINRDSNDFSIGFNIQTRFWDTPANKEQPDFEPAIVSYSASGALKWWSRLYHEVEDENNNGLVESGETRLSSPDQYVDGLALDYSTSPPCVVVNARCHGNNSINFWKGNSIAASPGSSGFQNQFTGTEGNIHVSWLGKLRESDGRLQRATYLSGYQRATTLTQAPYTEAVHDGWPSHNAGWPNLTTTRAQPGSMRVDGLGRVYLVGLGPRMVTTTNAFQKLPKITTTLNEGISPWAQFARVFEADLKTLVYSTALTGVWTYPAEGASPEGADNTDLFGICPTSSGLLTVGLQRATSGSPDGNAVPVRNVPAWGSTSPANVSAIAARLPFNPAPSPGSAPLINQAPVLTPAQVSGTTGTVSTLASDIDDAESTLTYSWSVLTTPAGGAATFSPNGTNASKSSTITFTRAGSYTLKVIVSDPSGQTTPASFNAIVDATPSSLSISPASVSVSSGGSITFNENVSDQFGQPISGQTVTWSVTGGGSIDGKGFFAAPPATGTCTIIASLGSLLATASATVVSATSYTTWRSSFFPLGTSEAQTAPAFDFDADGMVNLLEYALGTHPGVPSSLPAPHLNGSGRLQLQFERPTGRQDITTLGEYSTDLETWLSTPTLVETLITDLGGGTEQVTVREAATAPVETKVFLRIRVTQL